MDGNKRGRSCRQAENFTFQDCIKYEQGQTFGTVESREDVAKM